MILLDRDCKIAGSFHILDIEKFGVHKIISILSTPRDEELEEIKNDDPFLYSLILKNKENKILIKNFIDKSFLLEFLFPNFFACF